ncbi:gamma-glutamyltransferase [Tunturiibacter gelidoferens]|uniref:Gamma-glutamyltranspeptidase/glutathione hydrolase n=1 Tax=Tunturiibacter gelidiferens TaxID=3069689 RepID=A0ACC5NZA9_9BACT|nr:gamma-glutamyltranspeptidase/glutathione hydrolase [Edaphobacter lichenicola]
MRRRSFIASLPLVAAGSLSSIQPNLLGQSPANKLDQGSTPKFQPAGDERFIRSDVHAGDRVSGASFASRSAVMGCSGAAGTAHPLATLTAIEILKKGGSAIDAAVAANACLGFLEPTSSGIGGDCYAMIWDPKLSKVVGLAGSGRSPKSLTLETARARAKNGALPPLGAVTVSTPGALDAWWTLHQRYGKLKWAELFEPAIHLAESGVPVPQIIGYYIKRNLAAFTRPGSGVEETANALHTWAPNGKAPGEGDVFRNPDLARTYRLIAEGGRDAYYDGPIAKTIDAYFKRIGGWLSAEDLRDQHAEWNDPLVTSYRGVEVYGMAANTQGLATLQLLNIAENFDLRNMGFQSAQSLHVQIEAKRLAYEDRARYYADPHFAKIPIEWLNSKAYAAERAKLIKLGSILTPVHPGQAPSHGDTTYFTVADKDGLMISQIQSNFRGMGSGLVADGLGFMFQDRGQLFSLQDGHPNIYAPGKRPFQTIIPGFSTRDGKPWMSFGVMGGDMQPQGQAQIIINRVDYGLDIQAAGDSPRWHHEGSSQSMGEDPPNLDPKGIVRLEAGVPESTRNALIALGWPMGPSDGGYGRYECIEPRMSGADRFYSAASEMRADGCALAY